MIFFKILAFTNFESKAKQVILRAFLSKNGKNDIIEVIFLQNWACTIFFATKFRFLEKNWCSLWWPLMKIKFFAWGQLRNVHRYKKPYRIFRAFFLTVFDHFKQTVYNASTCMWNWVGKTSLHMYYHFYKTLQVGR